MGRHILILQGHPDPRGGHLDHALADAYAAGAEAAGHTVERIELARLEVPFLRSKAAFETGTPPPDVAAAQAAIRRAEHLVLVYPLWLGDMPALVKAFLEQALRPGFAFDESRKAFGSGLLKGRSARIVVTMGMPALAYRLIFRAHSLKSLRWNVLWFCGVRPVRSTLFGMIEEVSDARRGRWLARMRKLGGRAR